MSFLPVLRSIFSSSWLCWFTTVTCTQDISSRTAVALPRLTALHPSAPSGFGCQTTLCEKPACTRSCLPTLTCSSTRGCEDWAWLCAQKSSQKLAASQPDWPPPFQSDCHSCVYRSQHGYQQVTLWQWDQRVIVEIILHHESHVEGRRVLILNPEKEALNPKDYGPAGFSVKHLFKQQFLLCNILASLRQKHRNTWQYSALQIIALQNIVHMVTLIMLFLLRLSILWHFWCCSFGVKL